MVKTGTLMRVVIAASLLAAPLAFARQGVAPAAAPDAASAAFEKLTTLTGRWEARAPKEYGNATIRLDYRLISDDSVLMETFTIPEQDLEMVTMYHKDGRQLALTQRCIEILELNIEYYRWMYDNATLG